MPCAVRLADQFAVTEVRKECCALLREHAVELREDIEREVDGMHCEGAEV
jgi:hypothetical protein